MTYNIASRKTVGTGVVVIFDVLTDSGELVVGGLIERFREGVSDLEIDTRLESVVASLAAESIPGDATANELLQKRTFLKDRTISAMLSNPTVTLADIQLGLSWDDAKLVEAMVRMYAVGLRERGMLQDFIDTPDGCFDALRDFVQAVPAEQLEVMLRDEEMR